MAERPCALCTRPVSDASCCTRCRDGLARDLGDVDALDEQLTIVLCRQTAYAERNGPRSSTVPLPVDMRASEAAWVLRNTLTTWCRVLGWSEKGSDRAVDGISGVPATHEPRQDERGAAGGWRTSREAVSNPELSTWLLARVELIRHHEAADEIITEIEYAVRLVRNVVDSPAHRTTFPVGPCPENCPGEIRAYIPTADDKPATMTCTVDSEHTYEPYQWMRAGHRILQKREKAS